MPGEWCQCDSCHTELARSLGKMYHFVSLFLTLSVRIALWPYCWISVSRNTSNRSSLSKQGRSRKRERKEWVQEEKKNYCSFYKKCVYIYYSGRKEIYYFFSYRLLSRFFLQLQKSSGALGVPAMKKQERERGEEEERGGWVESRPRYRPLYKYSYMFLRVRWVVKQKEAKKKSYGCKSRANGYVCRENRTTAAYFMWREPNDHTKTAKTTKEENQREAPI